MSLRTLSTFIQLILIFLILHYFISRSTPVVNNGSFGRSVYSLNSLNISQLDVHPLFDSSNREFDQESNSLLGHKFLLCVTENDPAEQISDFVRCAIMARIHDLTLVLPPMFPRYPVANKLVYLLEHFYDSKALNKAVPSITLADFTKTLIVEGGSFILDCHIDKYYNVLPQSEYDNRFLDVFRIRYGKKIIFLDQININARNLVVNLTGLVENCSSILLHVHDKSMTQHMIANSEHLHEIFKYFRRIPLMKHLAGLIINKLPGLIEQKFNITQEKLRKLAVVYLKPRDSLSLMTMDFLNQIVALENTGVLITHLHIISHSVDEEDIKSIRKNFSYPFTTTNDINKELNIIDDAFFLEILEQEIAFQAPVFIGSPKAAFTVTVQLQKIYQKSGIGYSLINGKSGIPILSDASNTGYY